MANALLAPVIGLVTVIIPDITSFFTGIVTFIRYGLTYAGFFVNLIMVPKTMIVLLVTLTIAVWGVDLSVRAISLVMAVYHYFKP